MIFGAAGTFGIPEIFEALYGRPVKSETKTVHGVELVFQPYGKIPSQVQANLEQNKWDKWMFYGAFSLRPKEGAKAKVTFYEIDDDYFYETVKSRLEDWNMHGLEWFAFDSLEGVANGEGVTFLTERLVGDESLERPKSFTSASQYLRFLTQMLNRLRDNYPTSPEGQIHQRKEA